MKTWTAIMGCWVIFVFSGVLLAAFSQAAWAFPENVRHGYTNCTSCHINPNGQGQLNAYGRELSKAVQSYGKFFFEPSKAEAKVENKNEGTPDGEDSEAQFLYGSVARPSWLSMGGDIRFLQLFQFTPAANSGQFIVMQMDLEAAVTLGRFTFDATIGRVDAGLTGVPNPDFFDYLLSRRHYLIYQATDEIYVMGGRYWKPHGILDANHSSTVKSSMGWDQGSESYNIQLGFQGESWNYTVYGDLGRPDSRAQIEKGGGATVSKGFAHSYKAGVSYFYGVNDRGHRHVVGPWGLLGFTEHFYLNSETDFFLSTPKNGAETTGLATYNRLGYEWLQGFHTYLEQGFEQGDLLRGSTPASSATQIYGVGLLYYPRPHWEFEADYQKRQGGFAPAGILTDYAYLQLHYYL